MTLAPLLFLLCWWYIQEPGRKRHLLRLWLAVPHLRPLPQHAYDDLWGPIAADDRCKEQLVALKDAGETEAAAVGVSAKGTGAAATALQQAHHLHSNMGLGGQAACSSSGKAGARVEGVHRASAVGKAGAAAAAVDDVSAKLAARFGGSGMGCVPLDAEVGNKLRD